MKKSNLVLLIIVGVIFLLGIGVVFLWQRLWVRPEPEVLPPLPPLEVSSTLTQPKAPRYSLRATLPKVVKFPVYQWVGTEADPYGNRALRWAKILGFTEEPQKIWDAQRGTLYLWSKPGQTLTIDQKASSLSYGVDLLADPETLSGSFLPTFEQAAAIVRRILFEFSASSLLEFAPQKSQALKAGVARVREVSFSEAELVEVHFVAKVDDYPIYLELGPDFDPVVAWVGKDGKLLDLGYHPLGDLGGKIGDYPVKDEEELLKDLEGGKGVVVDSNLEGGQTIASVTITQVSLGYLLPQPDATTLQPIFVLSGQARAMDNKTGAVTIYLPAIKNF